ncbi:MAG TPA: hypothetical protein VFN45_00630 [Myxococcaceae bacterium]|nr:hypothetical protein [Myxococcaceae bacterium]
MPILLMQGMEGGAFTLFYPRQDRFGMWPFLLARALGLQTPEAFHVVGVLALCSGAVPLAALLGNPIVGVVTLMVPLVLRPLMAQQFLQAGQPYLWQLVTLLWRWWGIRLALEARSRRSALLGVVAAGVFTALSAWMNSFSLAIAVALVVIEAVRARAHPRKVLGPVAALALAGLFEAWLRHRYNSTCRARFGTTFVTSLRLDGGHLLENVPRAVVALWKMGGQVPLLLGAAMALVPGRSRAERIDQICLLVLALATLPAIVAVQYFRDNHFAGRYFAFATFWAVAAAVLGGLQLLSLAAGQRAPWVRILALGALVIAVPAGPADPLGPERAIARGLQAGGPTVLLADYWDVYVPASLAAPGRLWPIGAEPNMNRYPGSEQALQAGREVLVDCTLDRPDGTVEQYRALLRRTAAAPLPGAGLAWCPHRVERPVPSPRSP